MSKRKQKLLICCLCKKPIQPQANGWAGGNNPDPLSTNPADRCCDDCDNTKVIPARLEGLGCKAAVVEAFRTGQINVHVDIKDLPPLK